MNIDNPSRLAVIAQSAANAIGRIVHRLRHGLDSPYYTPQVVLARQIVNSATIIWAGTVLTHDNVLISVGAPYAWITDYVDENIIAAALGALSVFQIVWLFFNLRPRSICGYGYGVFALFWGFVTFSVYFGSSVLFPTLASLAPVIYGVSLYAFISVTKRRDDAVA